MFGNTLDEVMELQKDRFPYRKLPWIQVTLSKQVGYNHEIEIPMAMAIMHVHNNLDFFYSLGSRTEWHANGRNIPCFGRCGRSQLLEGPFRSVGSS